MSLTEKKPYVGVTGVTSETEATALGRQFSRLFPADSTHIGMAGYLVSDATLRGEPPVRSRYVPIDNLPGLLRLSGNDSTLNMIHYRTSDRDTPLALQLFRLFEKGNIYADGLCRAVQLNLGGLPRIDQLRLLRRQFPDLQIVMSITRGTMENPDPSQPSLPNESAEVKAGKLAQRLQRYSGLSDYHIVDPSGGRGQTFDFNNIAPYFRILTDRRTFPQPAIIAGGFNADNVGPRLVEAAKAVRTRRFGVDAEGALRTPANDDRNSTLDMRQTSLYVRIAAHVFTSPLQPATPR